MPRCYSGDLRERVIEAVEKGASRREAAEHFDVSVSSAIKWLQRWHESKSAAPKPRGGSVSPLEEFAAQILALAAEQPEPRYRFTDSAENGVSEATLVEADRVVIGEAATLPTARRVLRARRQPASPDATAARGTSRSPDPASARGQ